MSRAKQDKAEAEIRHSEMLNQSTNLLTPSSDQCGWKFTGSDCYPWAGTDPVNCASRDICQCCRQRSDPGTSKDGKRSAWDAGECNGSGCVVCCDAPSSSIRASTSSTVKKVSRASTEPDANHSQAIATHTNEHTTAHSRKTSVADDCKECFAAEEVGYRPATRV